MAVSVSTTFPLGAVDSGLRLLVDNAIIAVEMMAVNSSGLRPLRAAAFPVPTLLSRCCPARSSLPLDFCDSHRHSSTGDARARCYRVVGLTLLLYGSLRDRRSAAAALPASRARVAFRDERSRRERHVHAVVRSLRRRAVCRYALLHILATSIRLCVDHRRLTITMTGALFLGAWRCSPGGAVFPLEPAQGG